MSKVSAAQSMRKRNDRLHKILFSGSSALRGVVKMIKIIKTQNISSFYAISGGGGNHRVNY